MEEVATPAAYDADPVLVHRFYDARRAALARVEPNRAHLALARLEQHLGDGLQVVTQNIDDLHERAGSRRVLHMHGELRSALCRQCGARSRWELDLGDRPPCPRCAARELRPDVVWFGEVPHDLDRILAAVQEAELFVSIGTSGAVHPAAGFVLYAAQTGARTLELNLVPSAGTGYFDEARHGPAAAVVPAWVDELVAGEV